MIKNRGKCSSRIATVSTGCFNSLVHRTLEIPELWRGSIKMFSVRGNEMMTEDTFQEEQGNFLDIELIETSSQESTHHYHLSCKTPKKVQSTIVQCSVYMSSLFIFKEKIMKVLNKTYPPIQGIIALSNIFR